MQTFREFLANPQVAGQPSVQSQGPAPSQRWRLPPSVKSSSTQPGLEWLVAGGKQATPINFLDNVATVIEAQRILQQQGCNAQMGQARSQPPGYPFFAASDRTTAVAAYYPDRRQLVFTARFWTT